jgi:hypothetical protein
MNRQLLLHGGPILTMDRQRPVVDAVLCHFGRIVAAGSLDEVRAFQVGPVDIVDLEGRLACPGLNDAHAHVDGIGLAQIEIALGPPAINSIDDIRRRVRERVAATPAGGWIIGRGYDQASLAEARHPTREDLDDISPDHPVLLWRSCHHIAVANSRALALAGVTAATEDTTDGTIDRDEHGVPTGVLRESMSARVAGFKPGMSLDELTRVILLGEQELRRWGITSVTDAKVNSASQLLAYQRLRRDGELPVRTTLMMIIDETLDELIALGLQTGFGDDWLAIGPVKLFSDGSIGGRTARLREPYRDEPDNLGLWMIPPEEIREKVIRAHNAGFQIGIHAIGDAAIEAVLDAYEAAQKQLPRADARHRIEHCSLLDEAMIGRIKDLGVVPIPGTTFLYYTRPAYLQNLDRKRVRYAYAMKTFARNGIIAAASSDAPVVPANPLIGIQTMVTRKDRLGDTIYPEEVIPIEDALCAYTWNAAYATHSEGRKGAIKQGYLADITVFGTDLRSIDPGEIAEHHVAYTIADGRVVHEYDGT